MWPEKGLGAGFYAPGQVECADAIKQTTPFEWVANAETDVDGLIGRLESLADRLTGAVPIAGEKAQGIGVSGGLFSALEASAGKIRDRVRRAHELIDRIERRLP